MGIGFPNAPFPFAFGIPYMVPDARESVMDVA